MNYIESEPKIKIEYIAGNIENMKNALKTYQELITSDEAFIDGYCVVYFRETKESKEVINTIVDGDRNYTGEAVFFKLAVTIPELKEEIINTCKVIAKHFMAKDEYWDGSWIHEESPFGIEPLYLTAQKYPETGYLLASIFTVHWDEEHAMLSLDYLYTWVNDIGITKDTIKAFCYCDNYIARQRMLGYDTWDSGTPQFINGVNNFNLMVHFRKSMADYQFFRNSLIERYEQLRLPKSKESEIRKNIIKLYRDLLLLCEPFDIYDEDFDVQNWFTQNFINVSTEMEIKMMMSRIKEVLILDREVKKAKKPTMYQRWVNFFYIVFENGAEIWDYIESGKNKAVLDNLKKFEFIEEAKRKNCSFKRDWKYEDLESVFEYNFFTNYIKSFADECRSKLIAIRLCDVLHILTGKPSVIGVLDCMEKAVSLPRELLEERYASGDGFSDELANLTKELCSGFVIEPYEELTKLQDKIQANRIQAKKYFNNFLNDGDTSDDTLKGKLLICSYILNIDNINNTNDELTILFANYTNDNFEAVIFDRLSVEGKWPNLELVENVSQDNYDTSWDYHARLKEETLTDYEKLWKPFEKYLKTGLFEGANNFSLALNHLKENLHVNETFTISEKQPHYIILSCETEYIDIVYYVSSINNLECSDLARRLFKLLINIAPHKIIKIFSELNENIDSRSFYEDTKENFDKFIGTLNHLKNLGLADKDYWTYQLINLDKMYGKILTYEDLSEVASSSDVEWLLCKRYLDLLALYAKNETHIFNIKSVASNLSNLLTEGLELIDPKYLTKLNIHVQNIFAITKK